MSAILPLQRPQLTRHTAEAMIHILGAGSRGPSVAVLAIRGYFMATMGDPKRNDRGFYDDALFIISSTTFAAFNGNTDPSITRPRVAVLKPGVWQYKPGIHGLSKPAAQRYPAFVQAEEVVVLRDGAPSERGWFGINIHRGSNTGTSSLGCQTLPPRVQWDEFHTLLTSELKKHAQATFPYALTLDPRLA